jgi:hypothetical protein
VTVYCWIDHAYYDGVLGFSQVLLRPDPASPLRYFRVRWLDSIATYGPESEGQEVRVSGRECPPS